MEAILLVLSPFTAVGVLQPEEVEALVQQRTLMATIARRCIAKSPGISEAELHAYYNSCVEVRKQLKETGYEEALDLELGFREAVFASKLDHLVTSLSETWLDFAAACPIPPAHCGVDVELVAEETVSDVRAHLIQSVLVPLMRSLGVKSAELSYRSHESPAISAVSAQLGMRARSLEELRSMDYIRGQIQQSDLYRELSHASENGQRQPTGD